METRTENTDIQKSLISPNRRKENPDKHFNQPIIMYFPSFRRKWGNPNLALDPKSDRIYPHNPPDPEWEKDQELFDPEKENDEILDPDKKEQNKEFPKKKYHEEFFPDEVLENGNGLNEDEPLIDESERKLEDPYRPEY